ncbi:AI-2E family transporter [Solidesulfovibrio carbinolicus]|uniref:AI-2E family transporter n=1 Tax=Solidesulfovibrio carbinolicus TaxID=296842 RepID=A0A4P6HL76_9BACT|nr:AI-2E family transporter [Solidesulfovibrio carbinolicus]QAZ67426.1 AI-2E family transporter [Solidesulfovibrio carbinolicus]
MNQARKPIYSVFLLLILAGALSLAAIVLTPFVNILIIGVVLAALFRPIQRRVERLCGPRPTLAALLTTGLIFTCIIIPIFFFLGSLLAQGVQSVNALQAQLASTDFNKLFSHEAISPYMDWVQEHLPFLDLKKLALQADLIDISKTAGQMLIDSGTKIIGNVFVLTMNFVILMFVLFFLIRDGERMMQRLRYLLPLTTDQENRIFRQLDDVAKSVILGAFFIALAQGLAGGIGLFIVGIKPFFWGCMMGFASLIPVVGTAIIWLPVAIYLMLTGHWQWGLFLMGWGAVVVSGIDSIIRPLLMQNRSNMSTFWVFLSIIGGIKFFGALGILYGPLILGFAMVMLTLYAEDYRHVLEERGAAPAPADCLPED